jgi:hypothetical protein
MKLGRDGPNRRISYDNGRMVASELVDILYSWTGAALTPNDRETAFLTAISDDVYGIGRSWSANMPNLRAVGCDVEYMTDQSGSGGERWRGTVRYEFSSLGGDQFMFTQSLSAGTITTDRDVGGNQFPFKRTATIYVPEKTITVQRTETDWGFIDRGALFSWNYIAGGINPAASGGRYGWGVQSLGAPSAIGSQHQRALEMHTKVNSDVFLGCSSHTWIFMGAEAELLPEPWALELGGSISWIPKYRVSYHFGYRPYRALGWDWPHPDTGNTYEVYEEQAFGGLDLYWSGGVALAS